MRRPPAVLVVDDEPPVRRVLAHVLRSRGCEVVQAREASEALHLLRDRDFDAVLSDIQMPGLGGVEFFEAALRLRPDLARRFVFVSSHAPPAVAMRHGALHVAKPFTIAELWGPVSRIVDDPE